MSSFLCLAGNCIYVQFSTSRKACAFIRATPTVQCLRIHALSRVFDRSTPLAASAHKSPVYAKYGACTAPTMPCHVSSGRRSFSGLLSALSCDLRNCASAFTAAVLIGAHHRQQHVVHPADGNGCASSLPAMRLGAVLPNFYVNPARRR